MKRLILLILLFAVIAMAAVIVKSCNEDLRGLAAVITHQKQLEEVQ